MASPLLSTPPPKHLEAPSPGRRSIKTPHPKVFLDSPCRLTSNKVNVQQILTPYASSNSATPHIFVNESEITKLEITTVEKADAVFEAAVRYLDDAYLIPSKPRYQFVLLAQDLLYKVINYCKHSNYDTWRLKSFCKIEMTRVSPDLDFQRYWLEKGLNDLDVYSQTACWRFKQKTTELANEVVDCCATYHNIWKKCSQDFPDLAERAFEKHEECQRYLPQPGELVEVPTATKETPAAKTPETPHAKGKPETTSIEIATIEEVDAVFKAAVRYLNDAYIDPEKIKFDVILLAQDQLYKVLIYSDDNGQLPVMSRIEMTRVSSHPDFQKYWIKGALKALDNCLEKTCRNINPENKSHLINAIREYSLTYYNISKNYLDHCPELTEHAFQKYEECKAYLQQQDTTDASQPTTPAASPAKDAPPLKTESSSQQSDTSLALLPPTPTTSDKISTTNKTKAVFYLSLSVCLLGLAIAQRGRLKQLVGKISSITMLYITHPDKFRNLVTRLYLESRFNSMSRESNLH
jgi:hypothetical protein